MKTNVFLAIMTAIIIWGCNDSERNEIKNIASKIETYEDLSEIFIKPSKDVFTIWGKNGIIITINPRNLETADNTPIGDFIVVELIQLSRQSQFLRSNISTEANGRLIVSGGAFYINMTSDDKQLFLKKGSCITIEIPQISDDDMCLFYGQEDENGLVNWDMPDQTQEPMGLVKMPSSRNDTCENCDTAAFSNYYSPIEITSLGWINCDRFLNVENKTALGCNFEKNISSALIYLVFKDINSVLIRPYTSESAESNNCSFNNIPVGYNVRLLAVTMKRDAVYTFTSDFAITRNQTLSIKMEETSEEDLKSILDF